MADPLLQVDMLQAGYGQSTVLDGLSFSMGTESVAIIGRNGMGKTTLCKAIMGLVRPTRGSVVFDGHHLTGLPPEKISRAGIAYVPQGRRSFRRSPSMSIYGCWPMGPRANGGRRMPSTSCFPASPSAAKTVEVTCPGEQQMLAVGRALMLNGKLILMDEPSEGLAPTIVGDADAARFTLVAEGVAVLAVEQNIHAATAMADRQLAMVSGRIDAEFGAEEIRNDSTLQRLYLGVDA